MSLNLIILLFFLSVGIGLTALIILRPSITRDLGGKTLAFISVVVFPTSVFVLGTTEHLERSKKTTFCLSCHVMTPYGKSLLVDDKSYVAARHFQNNRVPKDQACYTCHTDYTMFGDFSAKFRGMRHLYAFYIGTIPDTLKLYSPYNNRECLHCHQGSRLFEENPVHADSLLRASFQSNEVSCLTSGCHDIVHNVLGPQQTSLWKGNLP